MTTNKRPGYTQTLSRVLIIANSKSDFQKDIDFLTAVTKVLSDSLHAINVENEYKIQSPLSLNSDKDIQDELHTYSPAQVMHIRISMRNPDSSEIYSLEISITDNASRQIVWKGVINNIPNYLAYANMKKSVNLILENLRKDEML